MKSSFELGGYEKGEEAVSPSPKKTKAGMNPITGTVLGDDGKEVAVTMVQMVEKFEKSCKVGMIFKHSGNLWVRQHPWTLTMSVSGTHHHRH